MEKERLLPISIICLAISLVVSSMIISKGLKESAFNTSGSLSGSISSIGTSIGQLSYTIKEINNNTKGTDKDLMNMKEAASYLGTSENNLFYSLKNKTITVPSIMIEGNQMFSKKAIDKWIEAQMEQ